MMAADGSTSTLKSASSRTETVSPSLSKVEERLHSATSSLSSRRSSTHLALSTKKELTNQLATNSTLEAASIIDPFKHLYPEAPPLRKVRGDESCYDRGTLPGRLPVGHVESTRQCYTKAQHHCISVARKGNVLGLERLARAGRHHAVGLVRRNECTRKHPHKPRAIDRPQNRFENPNDKTGEILAQGIGEDPRSAGSNNHTHSNANIRSQNHTKCRA